MSLNIDKDHQRARSRSRSGRLRDEGKPSYDTRSEQSYVFAEDDFDGRYKPSQAGHARSSSKSSALPYPQEGGIDFPGSQGQYSYDSKHTTYGTTSPPAEVPYRTSQGILPGAFPDDEAEIHTRYDKYPRDEYDERKGHYAESPRDRVSYNGRATDEDKFKYPPQKYSQKTSDGGDRKPVDKLLNLLPQKYSNKLDNVKTNLAERERERKERKQREKERDEDHLAYGKLSGPSKSSPALPPRPPRQDPPQTYGSYLSGSQWEDRRQPQYDSWDSDPDRQRRADSGLDDSRRHHADSYRDDGRGSRSDVFSADPNSHNRDRSRSRSRRDTLTVNSNDFKREKSRNRSRSRSRSRRDTLTVDSKDYKREKSRERSRDRRSTREKSPQPPTARMSSLTVDTGRTSVNMSLANAPGSPLLESYYGTYQNCSPMPSPLLLASKSTEIMPISPLGSDSELGGNKRSRRARFHDPTDNAARLASALKGHGPPEREPLVEILPSLTHHQVIELRAEYKQLVKTGSQGKGVNLSKHIRARLKDENPNLMKACYSVALGMWESEAYWANFWYQGDKTRRELLIEALMGRTNEEIRQIKDSFKDKKYDNSLTKCMKTELKEDKFKKAVLLVLEERRMEEYDAYGRKLPLDYQLVDQDVEDLRRAVKSEKGGESMMISIIASRSDSHLREILKEYEHHYRANFARDALKKSGNLVVSPKSKISLTTHLIFSGRTPGPHPQRRY